MTADVGSDAFTREIIRNKLLAIASEMGAVLARTSMSPIVYEVLDFACGHLRRLMAGSSPRTTVSASSPARSVRRSSRFSQSIPAATMRPGDIYMTNSPYGGGTHNADVALINPIFAGDQLIAFGISVTHWTEVGGKVLGSLSPDSTEIFQEGLQFPQLRLDRDGEFNAGDRRYHREPMCGCPRCRSAISTPASPPSASRKHA